MVVLKAFLPEADRNLGNIEKFIDCRAIFWVLLHCVVNNSSKFSRVEKILDFRNFCVFNLKSEGQVILCLKRGVERSHFEKKTT